MVACVTSMFQLQFLGKKYTNGRGHKFVVASRQDTCCALVGVANPMGNATPPCDPGEAGCRRSSMMMFGMNRPFLFVLFF